MQFDTIRHNSLTTEQAIRVLYEDESIYWTEDGYSATDTVDWGMVAIFFNTNEIHTYCQGMVTRIYL